MNTLQKSLIVSCLFIIIGSLFPNQVFAQMESRQDIVQGEVIVTFKKTVIDVRNDRNGDKSLQFAESKKLDRQGDIADSNIMLLKARKNPNGQNETTEQIMARLQNDPSVESVQPNFRYFPASIPTNDTLKDLLWALENTGQTANGVAGSNDADIDAPEAWAINEGTNASVIVAVIDTGVAYKHPDLSANMWDGTGCVSYSNTALGGCVHGYDFEDVDKTPLPTSSGHGTYVAGIIAAIKNNAKGTIGVAPNARIMALKTAFTSMDLVKAINFARYNGAKVINASWGGNGFDTVMMNAIASFPGLFIAASGNDSTNSDAGTHFYPSDYDLANIISVTATNQSDNLASTANYGITSVDIGAPGTSIATTDAGAALDGSDDRYVYAGGTSMAAPHVAGLVALLAGYNPLLTVAQIRNAILNNGDPVPALNGKTVTGMRINAEKALRSVVPNLILNPSLETAGTGGSPSNWSKGGFGTNDRVLTYPVTGQHGDKAARIDITSFADGNAKWYFANVPVTPGKTYTFSDYYKSDVPTNVVAQFKMTNGTFSYDVPTQSAASPTSWSRVLRTFTVPANVVSLTVFHSLAQIGYLITDNFSLTAVSNNLIKNPSFETAGTGGNPANWLRGGYGTNTASLTYPVAGQDSAKAARVDITAYANGNRKWYFDDVPVIPGKTYAISDYYKSNVTSSVGSRFKMTNGTYTYSGTTLRAASPTVWTQAQATITIPVNVSSLTVFHSIEQIGYLITDNFSLKLLNP
jgi:subtilisin family serine protease